MFRAAGAISDERADDVPAVRRVFEGHPTPRIPWVDVATGSLGQGLPYGVGMALAGKQLDRLPIRVWVLCGDSEIAEGSQWEALEHAAYYELDNLVAIFDMNRLGQRGETMHGWDLDSYAGRAQAFGCHAIEIDGHDVEAIDRAYAEALDVEGKPVVIVAKTMKGKGVAAVENKNGWHGKPLDDPEAAIAELGGDPRHHASRSRSRSPAQRARLRDGAAGAAALRARRRRSRRARPTATRSPRSARRAATSSRSTARSRTRPTPRSSRSSVPERFFEMYIAEQQMVATAVGMQALGWQPFASTFAAFLSRAYDFVRMSAISRANYCLVGSHAGISIGEDGPSQMALEDIASLRAVHGSTVLHPCDANQTAKLVDADGRTRTGSSTCARCGPTRRCIYGPDEEFEIGGSRGRCATAATSTIVGAGITVHEALKAAETLAAEGIEARVIDLYSIKPIDAATLHAAAEATGRIVTVEDHWPEGGLGEAVLSAFAGRRAAAAGREARGHRHAALRQAGGAARTRWDRRRRDRRGGAAAR